MDWEKSYLNRDVSVKGSPASLMFWFFKKLTPHNVLSSLKKFELLKKCNSKELQLVVHVYVRSFCLHHCETILKSTPILGCYFPNCYQKGHNPSWWLNHIWKQNEYMKNGNCSSLILLTLHSIHTKFLMWKTGIWTSVLKILSDWGRNCLAKYFLPSSWNPCRSLEMPFN